MQPMSATMGFNSQQMGFTQLTQGNDQVNFELKYCTERHAFSQNIGPLQTLHSMTYNYGYIKNMIIQAMLVFYLPNYYNNWMKIVRPNIKHLGLECSVLKHCSKCFPKSFH